jgi:hypothetical protein
MYKRPNRLLIRTDLLDGINFERLNLELLSVTLPGSMPLQVSLEYVFDSLSAIDKEAQHVLSEANDHQRHHALAELQRVYEKVQTDRNAVQNATTTYEKEEEHPVQNTAAASDERSDSTIEKDSFAGPVAGPSNLRRRAATSKKDASIPVVTETKAGNRHKPLLSHRQPQPPLQRSKKQKGLSTKELLILYPTPVAYASHLQTLYTDESSESDTLFGGLRILPVYRQAAAEKLNESTRLFLDALHRAGAFVETSLTPQTTHIVAYRPNEHSPVWTMKKVLRTLGLSSVDELSGGRSGSTTPPKVVDVEWVYESLEDSRTGRKRTVRLNEARFLVEDGQKANPDRRAAVNAKGKEPVAPISGGSVARMSDIGRKKAPNGDGPMM